MSDLPSTVEIFEVGPREGFQIEPGPIATARKIALIDALSGTGLKRIQVASFVNPKLVPGWADADEVVEGFKAKQGVAYHGLFFNPKGLERARAHGEKLTITGSITLSASEGFSRRNLNRSRAEQVEAQRKNMEFHLANGIAITRMSIMAAFGCNFSGDVPVEDVLATIEDGLALAAERDQTIRHLALADSMGWETPVRVERLVGAVRSRWPDIPLALHLHDTRGLAIASAHAALRMGVNFFDAAIGGLGGCPFAAQPGAAGNMATEEFVLLCEELGIETGVDLDALVEAGRLAEEIVGHPLPSTLLRSGPFRVLEAA